MSSLVRTARRSFSIENAKTMEEIEKDPEGSLMTSLENRSFPALPNIELSEKEARDFLQGKRLKTKEKDLDMAAAFHGDTFLGTAYVKAGIIHPKKVFS